MTPVRRTASVSTLPAVVAAGLLAAGLLAAGLLAGTAASPAAAALAAPAPTVPVTTPTVDVFVASNHAVAMTQRIQPGLHKFVVSSGGQAGFQILQAKRGYTKDEASRDINVGLTGGKIAAIKRFEANITLLGGVTSRPGLPGVMWLRLPAGRYWVTDTNAPTSVPGKLLTVTVAGKRTAGGVSGTATVRATKSGTWAVSPGSIAREGRLTFRNDSADNHVVELVKLADGKTIQDFRAWVDQANNGTDLPPPLDFAVSVDSGAVSPGHQMTMRYSLPAGDYVLVCWWPDAAAQGQPHALMGMFRGVTLS